jgi:hypothetical protein
LEVWHSMRLVKVVVPACHWEDACPTEHAEFSVDEDVSCAVMP